MAQWRNSLSSWCQKGRHGKGFKRKRKGEGDLTVTGHLSPKSFRPGYWAPYSIWGALTDWKISNRGEMTLGWDDRLLIGDPATQATEEIRRSVTSWKFHQNFRPNFTKSRLCWVGDGWVLQPIRSTTQILVETRHHYGIWTWSSDVDYAWAVSLFSWSVEQNARDTQMTTHVDAHVHALPH